MWIKGKLKPIGGKWRKVSNERLYEIVASFHQEHPNLGHIPAFIKSVKVKPDGTKLYKFFNRIEVIEEISRRE